MAREVKLPKLGQTMEEGTIVNTLVKIGDKVSRGDVLFEVETDKATLEVESPADGFVKAILVENGETLPVNTPILILGEENETVEIETRPSGKPAAAPAKPDAGKSAAKVHTPPPSEAAETPGPTTCGAYAQVGANNGRRNDCHYTGPGGR